MLQPNVFSNYFFFCPLLSINIVISFSFLFGLLFLHSRRPVATSPIIVFLHFFLKSIRNLSLSYPIVICLSPFYIYLHSSILLFSYFYLNLQRQQSHLTLHHYSYLLVTYFCTIPSLFSATTFTIVATVLRLKT